MLNIEKSEFRRGQWVGYGHSTVWRIIKNNIGYAASDQNGKQQPIYAKTLREMSAKLEKENPDIHVDINSHNQREAGAYMKNPAPKMRGITQDDINAAARGLRMLTMPQDELKQLVKETNPDNFAGAVIIAAAKQMIGAKRQVGMFKKNPSSKRTPHYNVQKKLHTRKEWSNLASFPYTPEGKKHAIQYARAYKRLHPNYDLSVR
jgi:hypothetical protein